MINSSLKSLSEFVKEFWESKFYAQSNGVAYPVTQFAYKDSSEASLEVIPDKHHEFALRKSKPNHESLLYPISKNDCSLDKANPSFLSFGDHKFLLDFEDDHKAQNFREDLQKLRR